jgi:superfamily I DNA and/or RNA helicase
MLSYQYRCHLTIANLSSVLFYKGRVQNGISEKDREPLYEMPTVALFDVSHGSEYFEHGSCCNFEEVETTVNLLPIIGSWNV